jgi:hypothetical protein
MISTDAIREALTPALLGEPMAAEVAALDGLPPPWMAVLGALVCCREHDFPATAADIVAWTATGAGPVHMLLTRAIMGEGATVEEARERVDRWRWEAGMVSPWPVLDGADPVAALRLVRAELDALRAFRAERERREAAYRAEVEARMLDAAERLRPALERRAGYAGPVHPGWGRYLAAAGALG